MKCLFFFPVLLLPLSTISGAAVVSDNFDTYPGTAGAGWTGGWTNTAGSAVATSSTNPVNGGGSYLTGSAAYTGTIADQGIVRTLSTSVVNTALHYTVSWEVRFEDLGTFDTFGDRVHFSSTNSTSVASGQTSSWLVGSVGADRTSAGNWYFYNNSTPSTNGNFNNADLVNTGIALVEGHTYSFLITVDPSTRTYDATVTDLDTATPFSRTGLNFRNQGANVSYQNFVFGTPVPNAAGHTREFSFDSLEINGVPEPSLSLLAVVGILPLLRRRRAR